jgi:fused signal recognition particle receptor
LFNLFGAKKDALPPETLDSSALAQLDTSPKESWLRRLKRGLTRSSNQLRTGLDKLLLSKAIDEMLFDDLETLLITADVGIRSADRILGDLRRAVKEKRITEVSDVEAELKRILTNVLLPLEHPLEITTAKPFVIMITGVNGSGKTTTIGKLAKYYQSQGKSVMLAAGDTFRAAAREQLTAWGARNNVPVVAQDNGDSAAVIFDAIHSARARDIDIVLADTAGRLPTQLHLMEEIKKVKRVIGKVEPGAPHETLLVLDANTGQNGFAQVSAFDKALQLSGLVITKLDGTARGGVLAALACERAAQPIPVRFIGVGEGIEDLRPFLAREFVDALFQ